MEPQLPPHNHPRLRENNFDLLRLLFAATVCLVHSYNLSNFQPLSSIPGILSSTVAVKAFFVVSGFLIFMSCERAKSLGDYAIKRARRIYPAYFTIVMLCAIGLLAVSSKSAHDYFTADWLKYVAANLGFLNFLHPSLPGVFEGNRLAAVNGALWTLKIEVMFYLCVPLFVLLFRKFSTLPVILLTYGGAVAYSAVLNALAEKSGVALFAMLARQLPGQLSYFMAGAFFYYFLPLFERRVAYFLFSAVGILLLHRLHPLPLLEPFALATVVVFFGLFLHLGNFGRYGDFSYGVYILHFPIIQVLLQTGWFTHNPWSYLIVVVSLTACSAVVMWHLVEKRFLFRSSHYIAATSAAGRPDVRSTIRY